MEEEGESEETTLRRPHRLAPQSRLPVSVPSSHAPDEVLNEPNSMRRRRRSAESPGFSRHPPRQVRQRTPIATILAFVFLTSFFLVLLVFKLSLYPSRRQVDLSSPTTSPDNPSSPSPGDSSPQIPTFDPSSLCSALTHSYDARVSDLEARISELSQLNFDLVHLNRDIETILESFDSHQKLSQIKIKLSEKESVIDSYEKESLELRKKVRLAETQIVRLERALNLTRQNSSFYLRVARDGYQQVREKMEKRMAELEVELGICGAQLAGFERIRKTCRGVGFVLIFFGIFVGHLFVVSAAWSDLFGLIQGEYRGLVGEELWNRKRQPQQQRQQQRRQGRGGRGGRQEGDSRRGGVWRRGRQIRCCGCRFRISREELLDLLSEVLTSRDLAWFVINVYVLGLLGLFGWHFVV